MSVTVMKCMKVCSRGATLLCFSAFCLLKSGSRDQGDTPALGAGEVRHFLFKLYRSDIFNN